MTTGILVGIGETMYEIIDSIFAIKQLHQKYGNIQEIILQNFQPKEDTLMKNEPSADEKYFKTVVALTRIRITSYNVCYTKLLRVGSDHWATDDDNLRKHPAGLRHSLHPRRQVPGQCQL